MRVRIVPVVLAALLLAGCAATVEEQQSGAPSESDAEIMEESEGGHLMRLTSPAFTEGQPLPRKYTCQGDGISPELTIRDVPKGTRSLAIIMDDPDAPMGTFVHWVVWNINPGKGAIAEGERLTNEGMTSFRRAGYGGPCPPSGMHRYFFRLYALDVVLELTPTTDKAGLERAMQGHILARAQLMGTYKKG